ncbi:Fc.00g032970.m01.CDS01 [Cosmosporella sp. VM-42]
MLTPMASFRRYSAAILVLVAVLCLFADVASAATKIRDGADPTIMKIGDTYYSAESAGGGIYVRAATTLVGLGASGVTRQKVWTDSAGHGDVWAPEITTDSGRTYIYFSAGVSANHRMYVISADSPLGSYSAESKLALPDDQWAIDGTMFTFEGQRWFVWSGWASADNSVEQNLYICKMNSPTAPTGKRFIISQPREPWEQGSGTPRINEGPEAIIDPNGQLHIVYSANGSWESKYCLGDLRLRKGGDPTYVWDWYKSNGCLFGSHQENMMSGWDATLQVDGPGHHTFCLTNGNTGQSPGGTSKIPFVFHAVSKGTTYSWANRDWFTGSFVWWSKTNYHRANVPGDNDNSGYSFKFFE